MKKSLPPNAKIAKDAKETVQECKDCEKRVKTLEKMRENNKQKLAEWNPFAE